MNQQTLQKQGQKSKFTNQGQSEPALPSAPVDYGVFSSTTLGPHLDELQINEDSETALEVKKMVKELEEYVKSRRTAFEEKMFERFYVMRIEQSRKFIDLIRKVNKSWDDFVDYLKSIGAQGASGDGTVYSVSNSNSLTGLSQVTNESN